MEESKSASSRRPLWGEAWHLALIGYRIAQVVWSTMCGFDDASPSWGYLAKFLKNSATGRVTLSGCIFLGINYYSNTLGLLS